MRLRRGRRRSRALFAAVVLVTMPFVIALGCGWNSFDDSVRFNFMRSERELQRLPPLPFKLRAAPRGESSHQTYVRERAEEAEAAALWHRADDAVKHGELARARSLLAEYVKRATYVDAFVNSAIDRLDALAALDAGAKAEKVRAYLDARRSYDAWLVSGAAIPVGSSVSNGSSELVFPAASNPAQSRKVETDGAGERAQQQFTFEGVREELRLADGERSLADNIAYLDAALTYREGRLEDAARAFLELASRYPRSEKREAALFMAGRAWMGVSSAFIGEGASATSENICRTCRDEAWLEAHRLFTRVIAEYPRGRLADGARGWLAYLSLRVGDTGAGLAGYYRILAAGNDAEAVAKALTSLRLVRRRADAADLEHLEAELEDEPRAALAYAYHEIYNYSFSYYFISHTLDPSDNSLRTLTGCYPEAWRDDSDEIECRVAERANLTRVARFAARMVRRHGEAAAGGAFVVRAAQANLEIGEDRAALEMARRALALGVSGEARAGALWVEGTSLYRLRDYAASRRALARAVEEFAGGDIEHHARRLLAVVAEDAGDMEGALEQYLALRYDPDAAYFVDVLMTPDQLAAFIAKRTDAAQRDRLLYALGIRYLRAGRYAEARDTLLRVKTTTAREENYYEDYYGYDYERKDDKYRIRQSFYEDDVSYPDTRPATVQRESGVYADWVSRDLKTAEDLERLERTVERATGEEARAEAMYQLAGYLYEGSNLKFYNPAAWRGMRSTMLRSLNEKRYRSAGEAQTVLRHSLEHESVARALDIYLEIVRRYPATRAARDALYTAILCHQRLANFNGYWRGVYASGLHAGTHVVTYADLRRAYPDYRPPREGDWRPSTRTVNGESAWPAPVKPQPLKAAERVRRKISRIESGAMQGWMLFGEVAGGRVRRWSLVIFFMTCALVLMRLTRRSRARLLSLLVRAARTRREAAAELCRAPVSSYGSHEAYRSGGGASGAVRSAGSALWRVALDERGRAALALNLLTHGLLTVLLYAAAWALRSG